jgi:phosphoribosylformylglycinamidine synthase
MRACVVVFPGINADTELVHTLRDVCGAPTTVVWHTETKLPDGIDLVAIPGGFAYGDYLRAGALAKVSPIIPALRAHAERGAYVLGICNGFQILTEIGMLPGALTRNSQMRFECGDWHVKVTAKGPFTRKLGTVWRVTDAANPNGSIDAIAGIYGGPSKNVFGLMPHPERMSEALLGCADGRQLFESVLGV